MNIHYPHSLLALSSIALLSACSSPVQDTTPINPTTVVTAKYSMSGLLLPDGQGNQVVYTRPEMRNITSNYKADSFLSGFANFNKSDIFRLDKNLLWEVDHDAESYRECPLQGCTTFSFADQFNEEEETEEYQSYDDMDCAVSVKQNEFDVKATGNHRVISGIDANEYLVTWSVVVEDKQKNKDSSLLRFNVWTAKPDNNMKQAWVTHAKATDNYLNAVGDNHPLVRLIGRDGFKAISAFAGDIEKTDTKSTNAVFKKLNTINGYPLSLKMEFFQQSLACQEEKQKASNTQLDFSNGVDGLKESATGMVGDFFSKKVDEQVNEWTKDALFRYVYEVTSVSEQGIRDSTFAVPADYRLVDRQ